MLKEEKEMIVFRIVYERKKYYILKIVKRFVTILYSITVPTHRMFKSLFSFFVCVIGCVLRLPAQRAPRQIPFPFNHFSLPVGLTDRKLQTLAEGQRENKLRRVVHLTPERNTLRNAVRMILSTRVVYISCLFNK